MKLWWAIGAALTSAAYAQDTTKQAVQAMLDKQPPACVSLFDANDPTGHLQLKRFVGYGLPFRVRAYYEHGLLVRSDAHVQLVTGAAGFITSHGKNAWRYDWSPEVTARVVNDQLCYAFKPEVVSVKVDGDRVSYTWRYSQIADWAKQEWVKQADPDVWQSQIAVTSMALR